MPISARKSRGGSRIYWVGDDASASERFGREFSMAMARDVHCEDRAVIEAGQQGLNSGALRHIHFQEHEILLRLLMHHVDARVQAYTAECEEAAAGAFPNCQSADERRVGKGWVGTGGAGWEP